MSVSPAARVVALFSVDGVKKNAEQRVENCSEHVNCSGQALDEIVDSLKHEAIIFEDMSRVSMKQSQAVIQINATITAMDDSTYSNTEQTAELASTSQPRRVQARQIRASG